jgi:acetyl esterase/lipase
MHHNMLIASHSDDKSKHALLARRLATATGFPVAVPNYRLTKEATPIQHPAHAEDVLTALYFLLSWHGPLPAGSTRPHLPYDPTRLFVIAHSCAAHIIASIVLDSSKVTPSLTPHTSNLLASIQGIALTEGIYDIDLLLSSFPPYKDWFIARAFGSSDSFAPFSVTGYPMRIREPSGDEGRHIKWLIIHSQGDTLVDLQQSEGMYKHLLHLYGLPSEDNVAAAKGHASEGAATIPMITKVFDFTEEHDDVLLGDRFLEIVKGFMLSAV